MTPFTKSLLQSESHESKRIPCNFKIIFSLGITSHSDSMARRDLFVIHVFIDHRLRLLFSFDFSF